MDQWPEGIKCIGAIAIHELAAPVHRHPGTAVQQACICLDSNNDLAAAIADAGQIAGPRDRDDAGRRDASPAAARLRL